MSSNKSTYVPHPLSFTVNSSTREEQMDDLKRQQKQEKLYKLDRKLREDVKKGYMLISENPIEDLTNIYEYDHENNEMIYKGYYNATDVRKDKQKKTTHGHIITGKHYVKMEHGKSEKMTYADHDMYGGKSRKNKRTNKRKSRKIRKSRKNRK